VEREICPSVRDPLFTLLPKNRLFILKFDVGNFYFDCWTLSTFVHINS
jgi:hypothetical protein